MFQILAYMVDHVTKSQMAIVVSVHLVTKAITVSFPSATMVIPHYIQRFLASRLDKQEPDLHYGRIRT